MKNLTNEQLEGLKNRETAYIAALEGGEDVRTVLARIYVENLDDKTEKQGLLIADTILKSVRGFDADYAEARTDVDRYVDKLMKRIDGDRSCAERCEYWLKLSAGIAAAASAAGGEAVDREAVIAELGALSVPEGEATPELEEKLRAQAKEALMKSGVLLGSLAEQAEALAGMDTAEEAAELLINIGSRDVEYRAILSMLAYTDIISGVYEDMPVNMGAAQVAAVVCAQIEQARILEAVGNGSLAVDLAVAALTVLGIVLLANLCITAAFAAISAVSVFSVILAIPAAFMVGVLTAKAFLVAADEWAKLAEAIVKFSAAAVRTVMQGARTAAEYADRNIIPKVAALAADMLEKLRSFVHTGQKAETVEDEEEIVAAPAQ